MQVGAYSTLQELPEMLWNGRLRDVVARNYLGARQPYCSMLQTKEEERLGLRRLITKASRVIRRHVRTMMACWLSIGAGLKPGHPDNVAV